MKCRNYIYILITLFVFSFQYINAQIPTLSDNAEISLLTNSLWDEEVYAVFGHTAIRVSDPINRIDVAFNYGTFDFDSPNFMYRFLKGETDYWLSLVDFDNYIYSYSMRRIGVTEQILNLTQAEKQQIFDALVVNSLPENSTYRYNYFYDNCTSRAQNIIEKNLKGNIEYKESDEDVSFRDLLHNHLSNQKWLKFGIDLVIGADADKKINDRQKDFLPITLEQAFGSAKIKEESGDVKNLVKETKVLSIPAPQKKDTNIFNTPLFAGFILLLITVTISYLDLQKKLIFLGKFYDAILFFVAGITGSVIFFLMFFSLHPCTNPNWNIIWLNPLQLLFSFFFYIKALRKYTYYYHFINFALLTVLFLVWFLIPQYLDLAFLPFIISLWMRSGINIIQYKKSISNTK